MVRHVFVISDLHLGGRPDPEPGADAPGTQINRSQAALTEFIDWIRTSHEPAREGELELVINGDIVDFLAEDDLGAHLWTANEEEAVRKLELIFRRSREYGQRGVVDALADLLAAGHRLTLLLGNHDVELALPAVRARLIDELGAGDLSRRLHFIYDGEAYTLGKLLIEHGNRYDRWNMIDHSRLRQERSVRSRRLEVDEKKRAERFFTAPAGTHLVIRFMNRIKARYRFVDLLKPEDAAVVPLLLALEPDYAPVLHDILQAVPLVSEYRRHGRAGPAMPSVAGDMSMAPQQQEVTLRTVLQETLGPEAVRFAFAMSPWGGLGTASGLANGDMGLLRRAGARLQEALGAMAASARSFSQLTGLVMAGDKLERLDQLHSALRHLGRDDRTFREDFEKPEYLKAAIDTTRTGAVDVVVYGHTHLPKVIDLSRLDNEKTGDAPSRGRYFNTGTWCDVMRLPDAILKDGPDARKELGTFVEAIRKNDFTPYLKRYLSYFEAVVDLRTGQVMQAQVHSYCGPDRERSPVLTEYPLSQPTTK
jgi:UDP-2,3-diacylglucosamine pyrophosphatase LpxH